MICISVNAAGVLQKSGDAPCPNGSLVAFSELEFTTATASPWNLSLSDGGLIGAAIVGVWAIGYCIRSLVRVLSSGDSQTESNS